MSAPADRTNAAERARAAGFAQGLADVQAHLASMLALPEGADRRALLTELALNTDLTPRQVQRLLADPSSKPRGWLAMRMQRARGLPAVLH